MRNNVNSNGLIYGGYTENNQNVIQLPYFNSDTPSGQLTPGSYLTSQSFIGSPQQMPYQSSYNSMPNYYHMGIMNYQNQTTALPYGQVMINTNTYPNHIPSTPARLNIMDPMTGSKIDLSRPITPVAPRRRSGLQIIDPKTKNEIDVTKIRPSQNNDLNSKNFVFNFDIQETKVTSLETVKEILSTEIGENKDIGENLTKESIEITEKKVIEEDSTKESLEIAENKDIKENLTIESIEIVEEKDIELCVNIDNHTQESIPEPEYINTSRQENIERNSNIDEDIETLITENENSTKVDIPLDELELKDIISEINENNEDDFTEVVSKKKKKQQSKVQEVIKPVEPQPTSTKKENVDRSNGFKKENRNDKNTNFKNRKNSTLEANFKKPNNTFNKPEPVENIEEKSSNREPCQQEQQQPITNNRRPSAYDQKSNYPRNFRNDNNVNMPRSDSQRRNLNNGDRHFVRNGSRNREDRERNHTAHGQDQRNGGHNGYVNRQESRNDYRNGNNRNRNMERNGSQNYHSKDFQQRNTQNGYNYRNEIVNDNRHTNRQDFANDNVYRGNNTNRSSQMENAPEHDVKQNSKLSTKHPMNFNRAFRKSSMPLVVVPDIQSEKESKKTDYSVEQVSVEIIGNNLNLVETTFGTDIIDKDNLLCENSTLDIKSESPIDVVEQIKEEVIDNVKEEVIKPKMMDSADVLTGELENVPIEELIVIETTVITLEKVEEITKDLIKTEETIEKEILEIKHEKINTCAIDIKEESIIPVEVETEVPTGRLTYYRDMLISLRGNQSLPEDLFRDHNLIDVIAIKMQFLNFLKRKELFKTPSSSKHDYLDFTRRTHHVKPKRLIRGDNGYLPPQLRKVSEDKVKLLMRNIKSILNKMTPENFDICTNDLVNLDMAEEENMRILIAEIFSKAIQEESYSSTYAKFCAHICSAKVGYKTFKSLLLKNCQVMFEKPLHLQLEEVQRYWEEKAANEKDEKMKKLYESDIEEQVKKAKDKYFGNIRFFSELFLANQLARNIIISCVEKLLQYEKDNNSLEAACRLIQICGSQLDKVEKESASREHKFSKIMLHFVALSNRSDIEARLRFKFKDIVDMRERNWELRGIQKAIINTPKTLEEIKDDRTKEEMQRAKINYRESNSFRSHPVCNRQVMDTRNLQMNPQNVSKETVLGPQIRTQWGSGCKSNTSGWNSVSTRKLSSVSVQEKMPVLPVQNKYAQLTEEVELKTVPDIPMVNNDEALSNELFELIMKNICPISRWKEVFDPVVLIDKWFYLMFDRKIDCRMSLGDFFHDLIAADLLTFEQLLKGTITTMEAVDDIIDDVPNFWIYLGQFLERFIKTGQSDIGFITVLLKETGYEKGVEKCMTTIKESSSARIGDDIIEDLFRKYQQ